LTNFIDTAVTRSINLDYIDVLSCSNRLAAIATIAGFTSFPICTLKRLSVDAGRTCFPNAPRTSEEIGVPNAAGINCPGKSTSNMFLTN
jgi:hypothetical protein